VGTAIGGVVGWFATTVGGDIMVNPLLGGFVGCVIGAIVLHSVHASNAQHQVHGREG